MHILEDTLRQIAAWRTYRAMLDLDRDHYERLVRDLALVIRSRVGR